MWWSALGAAVDSVSPESPLVAAVSWLVTGGVATFAAFLWRRMENLYQQASNDHEARIEALKADNQRWRDRAEADRARMESELSDHRARLAHTEEALRAAEIRAHECELRNRELAVEIDHLKAQISGGAP